MLLAALNESGEGQDSLQMIDSTIVRAHQHAAEPKKSGRSGRRSWPLARWLLDQDPSEEQRAGPTGRRRSLTGGEVSDIKGYAPVMAQPGPEPKVLLGDKGYDADAILADLDHRGAAAIIPPKRNRTIPRDIDGHLYALRNLVERCFLQTQTQPQTGDPLRQDRRQLPRLRARRFNPAMGEALCHRT